MALIDMRHKPNQQTEDLHRRGRRSNRRIRSSASTSDRSAEAIRRAATIQSEGEGEPSFANCRPIPPEWMWGWEELPKQLTCVHGDSHSGVDGPIGAGPS